MRGSRIQKSCTGDNNFVKWKGTFRSDRPKIPDRSKVVSNIPVGPNRNDPFHSISGILGSMESTHSVRSS